MKRSLEPLIVTPGEAASGTPQAIAVLIHLSGPLRGRSQRLSGDMLRLGARKDLELQVSPEPTVASHHATLRRDGASFLLVAQPDCALWVNGVPVRERRLASGDVLEIGPDGPILRFRLYPPGTRLSKSVFEAFSDGIDSARFGSGSRPQRVVRGVTGTVRELATQTTMWFRVVVVVAIAVLLSSSALLLHRSRQLEERLVREELRVAGLTSLLEESDRLLSGPSFDEVRRELSTAQERLDLLEARSDAASNVVASAARSVMLMQGAYGFVDTESGAALRFLGLDATGEPLRSGAGDPLVAVGGEGPLVEAQFLGSAFVVSPDGLLITNRHVALPWEYDADARLVISQGLEARMHRMIGYVPEEETPFKVSFVAAAGEVDLAVLWAPQVAGRVRPLALRRGPVQAGEEVIVLGYPAGLRALLARSDERFVSALMSEASLTFWEIAERLAEAGQIGPLASRGIVAQVGAAAVVYDAETTRGGSGGPVLDLDGAVVAVTSAVVSEFGGSNIGVPADRALELVLSSGFARPPFWRLK